MKKLYSYDYRGLFGSDKIVTAPKVFKTPRGANSSGIAFRKAMGREEEIEIRVVDLVVKGSGRVASEFPGELGRWH